jgi:hypothetical protein
MTERTLKRIVALGPLTGMRSMAGLATLAVSHGGATRAAMAVAAAGEMIADKTSWIGDQTAAIVERCQRSARRQPGTRRRLRPRRGFSSWSQPVGAHNASTAYPKGAATELS